MTKEFEKRVLREGIVDTEKYRYVSTSVPGKVFIKRLPIEKLDTIESINEWEVVKKWEDLPV